jgi:hypothetical protein
LPLATRISGWHRLACRGAAFFIEKRLINLQKLTGLSIHDLLSLEPKTGFDFIPALPAHADAEYTWRLSIPDLGLFMGPAVEEINANGNRTRRCADPDLFAPAA